MVQPDFTKGGPGAHLHMSKDYRIDEENNDSKTKLSLKLSHSYQIITTVNTHTDSS